MSVEVVRATVTQASPLLVRVDGAATATAAEGLVAPLLNARVHVAVIGTRLLVLGLTADPAWITVGTGGSSYGSGVGPFSDGAFSPPQFRRTGAGMVVMRGLTGPVAGSAATVLTLPPGYRPAGQGRILPTVGDASFREVRVETSGVVTLQNAGVGSWLSLASVTFLAEQ